MSEPTMTRTEIPEWTLGWKLKRALSYAGLSAQDMAAELGVHVATVSRWMNDREHPRRAYVMAWALRCGVPFGWLTGDEPVKSVTRADIPAGISAQPGHQVIDNPITRSRKRIRQRIPLNPMLQLLKAVAA